MSDKGETMSEQNNNQQGYVQNGYPQQQVNQQMYYQQQGQMNQQVYQQQVQGYQQMNPQGYTQQGAQPNQNMYQQGYMQGGQPQGYPQKGYQQPAGGSRPPQPKKSKTGLIVGIVIAVVALIVGAILLIFKDKIFGSDDKKTTESTMEITTEFVPEIVTNENPDPILDEEGGFEDYEDLLPSFWEAFEYCDEELMNQCFYMPNAESAQAAENNYNNALAKADSVEVHYYDMIAEYDVYGEMGLVEEDIDDRDVLQVKQYRCEVPMTQEVDGVTYEIIDIYEGTIYQLDNERWYLSVMQEVDVQIVSTSAGDTTAPATTTTQELGDTKTMGSDECGYIDVPTDWMEFSEIGGIDGVDASYQVTSSDMKTIVTMCVYSGIDPYDAATNMYNGLVADGNTSDLVSATATIGIYDAYQVYAVYSDSYFVTYFFEAEDGKTHYVAVEFPVDQAGSAVVQNIESSYRLTQ